MFAILASMIALILAVGLLQLGSGMFNTFLGLRAVFEGFPKEVPGPAHVGLLRRHGGGDTDTR